ncbi:hypothetical protein [Dyadobacter psychrotolerans]|uniref:Uncharacterized protein n=1 Tax=Dyadobacter psychrotolerans TaxID=2541721 RepID=A0A4R5DT91_9BACT|nr:hypothetical protein [Dyadobacter psychrotolerans]TDE17736.1 hypothetical protein E0F88_07545 [Dyadobacter psychrotolerans]
MTEIKHTPTPWKVGDSKKDGMSFTKQIEFSGMGRTSIGFVEAPSSSTVMMNQAEANAEFIVRACNAHEDNLKRFARIRQIAEGNGYDEIAEICNEAFSQESQAQ